MNDELVSLSDAARRLNTSRITVGRIVRRGNLATFESPLNRRKTLVHTSDVEALRQPRPANREKLAETSAA